MVNKTERMLADYDQCVSCDDSNECTLVQFYKQRTEYLEDLVRKYKFDYLTGLMGKLDYEDKIGKLFEEYKLADQKFFFVMIDIDDLHNMNRMYGYHYGDEVIKRTAKKIREYFEFHQVYRISGDEFIILVRSYHITREEIEADLDNVDDITYVIETVGGFTCQKHLFKCADKKLTLKKKEKKRV